MKPFEYFISWIGLVSIGTLLLFGFDKWRARRGLSRIAESTLLLSCTCGGWLGGLLGIIFLRHKSAKPLFLLKFSVAFIFFALFCGGILRLIGRV